MAISVVTWMPTTPGELPWHLFVEAFETAIVDVETSVEASLELSDGVPVLDQRVRVLAHLTLQIRHPFFERGHGSLLEHSALSRNLRCREASGGQDSRRAPCE
jgi:hypothetical protein